MQSDNFSKPYILTADIGGSHIAAAICDMEGYIILPESVVRAEVDSKSSADQILLGWKTAFDQVLAKNLTPSVSGLSIAMPGPFDYERGISYIKGLDKYESLYGLSVKSSLGQLLNIDQDTIRFRNDAESTVAGEAWSGAGKNYLRVMGITLGTGFGSAYTEHGVTKDLNLGSQPYKESIADDYFSTRWFLGRYREITSHNLTGGVKQLAKLAQSCTVARDLFAEFANNLSNFLSGPIAQYRPEVLVICGNIALSSELFLPQLKNNLGSAIIQLAQLGELAPLIGAAALFDNNYGSLFTN